MLRLTYITAALLCLLPLAAPLSAQSPATETRVAAAPQIPMYALRVLSVRDHDTEAFTQGLLMHDGKLYESTGLEGKSSLRRVDPVTGVVEKKVDIPAEYFGEGLALVDNRLIMLTWKHGKALVYDLESFEHIDTYSYTGEGWGLAYDGEKLIMTDGSSKLFFRDPKTFELLGEVEVRHRGRPMRDLNELEYVEGVLYANVWRTDLILRIDPNSGEVIGIIQAGGLLAPQHREKADVLNGIAWDPNARSLLITGKLWPKLFEVEMMEMPTR